MIPPPARGRRQLDEQSLIAAASGALEAPIRAVLFGQARFEQHGHSLALAHEIVPGAKPGQNFFPRLRSNIETLQQARSLLEQRALDGRHLGPAAHWLLDNAPLIDEQLYAIRQGLPRSFFRLLPRLRDEPLAGLPRIYGVAWAWVAHTDSGFDPALLSAYLRAYQAERELSLAELWALPTTLRVVLIENLRRLAERSVTQQAARDAAHRWFDKPQRELAELEALEPGIRARGVATAFYLQLEHRQEELPPEQAQALDAWLASRLPDPSGSLAHQQNETIEDQQSIRNAIVSLRLLDRSDWRKLIAGTSSVMQILQGSAVHRAEAEITQDATLHAVERLARRCGRSESAVALLLVQLAQEAESSEDVEEAAQAAPAYWWRGPGRSRLYRLLDLPAPWWPAEGSAARRALASWAYLGSIAALSSGAIAWLLWRQGAPGLPAWLIALTALLLLGPVSEAVVALVNRLISESARPALLPRLAFAEGLPETQRALVVMPVMLASPAAIAVQAAQLEQHYLANAEAQAQFALLSDYLDAPAERQDGDAELLAAAETALAGLNLRHPAPAGAPPRFLLLQRERRWSETEQCWMGWERKRGKLEQLLLALDGAAAASPFLPLGALSQLAAGIRYIVTLDADTDLPPGRLRALVGMAAHPLNLPRLDAEGRRVVDGHAILQPRVMTPLPRPEEATPYHRLFSGEGGIDPYSVASSEIYQDLFDEGSFTGKGLLHVAALRRVLAGRLPEGQVLSHDLLEGSLARCAGVSDITLMEQSPFHADVAAARLHRWTRGDWQLLPFLLRPRRYPMAAISRWKMIDNLRRSLVAPVSLALLLLVLASGVLPLGWALGVVGAAFSAGPLLGAIAGLAPSRDDIALQRFYRLAGADVVRALLLALWHGAQLLQLGLMYGDAIGRALYRQFVSRRHLLEWTTAEAAERAARTELPALLRLHRRVPLTALGLLAALGAAALLGAPVHWPGSLALLALWAAAPLWTWLASRPRRTEPQQRLDEESRDYLQGLARDSWRYYEQHIGPEDHHLPPDNVQLTPRTMVAHRSSPTNFGLYLLAVACAQELGFIGRAAMAERLQLTLATLERLPRWRGHFYNWYDTQSLAVLTPAYVSAVDSGNCSAHLLAVARACELATQIDAEAAEQRARRMLQYSLQRLRALQPLLSGAPSLQALAALASGEWAWPESARQLQALNAKLRQARHELDALHRGLGEGDDRGAMWLAHDLVGSVESALRDRSEDLRALNDRLRVIGQRLREIALEADFAALYDRERRLLHIGYRADSQQLDDNHYDLLASEARLTSLLAIAKGDVPVEHWSALGRPLYAEGHELGLKSWSGSMFEYLMPSLVLDEPPGSVLGQAVRSAVIEQRAEGAKQGTPWGISESAIAGQDHTLAYQYGPQGAPRLALRRTPRDERVLAPYATLLALEIDPCAAVANLRALQELGARRAMGFIEALDYTPQRQAEGSSFTLVQTYMTHHQAMGLVALCNLLADEAPRRWAMSDAHLRAVGSLLHERAPYEVARLSAAPPLPPPRTPRSARLLREIDPLQDGLPCTQLLTNGRYAVLLRSHGGGYSSWDGVGLTRWRDDLLRDGHGSFFYLQRSGVGGSEMPWQSLTAHPAPDRAARYRCRMQADRVIFDAHWPDCQSRITNWVSPEDDCELRQLELSNTGKAELLLNLMTCFEASLAPHKADEAHPAFSNLFVQMRWDAVERVLYLRRRPRLPDEQAVLAVHFLAGIEAPEGAVEAVEPCSDRARWLGRYGSVARPLGDAGHSLLEQQAGEESGPGLALDTGLDPLAGIGLRLRLAPGASLRLTFCSAAAHGAETLDALVDKYRQAAHVERASSMSHTMAGIRLRELQFDADTWAAMLRMNTVVSALLTREGVAAPRATLPGVAPAVGGSTVGRCDRRLLWRHGISGDRPIIWVAISGEEGLGLVQALKKALRLWSACGLGVDLVVSNGEPNSYLAPVQQALQQLLARHQAQQQERPAHLRASLHVLREQDLSADERYTLQTLARLKLLADGRSLAQQLERWMDEQQREFESRRALRSLPVPDPLDGRPRGTALPPDGRFHAETGAFAFELTPTRLPARPWANVLANAGFGCQVTELAGGYCWAGNSRMQQLTPWSNDPLTDPAGEWLLLQDLDQGRVWPLGRHLPSPGERASCEIEHGIGYSRHRQRLDGLEITLSWCVDVQASLKQLQVQIRHESGPRRRLRLVALAEWQLGSARQERLSVLTRPTWLITGPEGAGLPRPSSALALLATQLDHLGGFGESTAVLALRPAQAGEAPGEAAIRLGAQDWTCDRREFFDSAGRMVLPARLGQRSGAGLDPCAALGAEIDLPPDGAASLTVLLGHGAHPAAAQALLEQAWAIAPAERLARQREQWPALLGGVQVQTPDPQFDALVNHWLPYQTLVCRIWARAGFYQAGGAFGYRDQLQDAMALATRAPALLAEQILRCAARQFPEGDVQHWWHEPGGAGVRTHFSDDRLWLPYALAHYVQRSGDLALLDEALPFLVGQQVPPGAEDIYETPGFGGEAVSLYEHAARAIDRSLASGAHGLPLFGTGDWNDGMNRVGDQGRGESVWLAWFLCQVIADFSPIAAARQDQARVQRWQAARAGWARALDEQAWDGAWYLRGFFDDGTPLGSSTQEECRIDLIAQAWAVLSGAGDPARARQAMVSAGARLMDGPNQLLRLLDPPLARQRPSAGYIQAYPPGVRENGGQYNHGAVWALMALAQLGQRDAMWQVFRALSPAHRWQDRRRGSAYAIEPYVMAGDVYTQPPYIGRGGWSWYTGSAGWLLRAAVESICGVVLAEGRVSLQPCLPAHWLAAEVALRHGEAWHRIIVCADEDTAEEALATHESARPARLDEQIDLSQWPEGSVHVVVAPPAAPATALVESELPVEKE
ncbi:GH36-type glycosyl hydrolase domain-containing protein [Roseateles violae]|uniref:Glucoamylase family protein n=1 Tax=Roseateles violae TaxID=3058042 RepID=A0ABT8DW77_9BURK|nr:glucoamylase family protein [Pelomonas sp. PFR6]MDN3920642.1 glucoamylase family protein [Pelomonas sp. PFR6]